MKDLNVIKHTNHEHMLISYIHVKHCIKIVCYVCLIVTTPLLLNINIL